jgi:basic amino acid/polyamine antiporter, APA family
MVFVPVGEPSASESPLLEVVRAGAPGLSAATRYPLISMFAVASTALINTC